MKIRLAYTAPGWLLCAATSVILVGNTHAQTTDSRGNPPKTLDSAVQREMELLLARNKSRASKVESKATSTSSTSRVTKPSAKKPKKSISLMRRWFGPKKAKPVSNKTPAKSAPATLSPATLAPAKSVRQAASKPATIQQTANQVVQQRPAKSAIEIELEKLYQKDGRPMPPLNLRSAPNTNHPVPHFKPQPASQQTASSTSTSKAATTPQPKRRSIGGFFQRLNPFRKKAQPPKPAPQDVARTGSVRAPQATRPAGNARPATQVRQPARLPVAATKSVSPSLPIPPLPQSAAKSVANTGVSQPKPIQPAKATADSDQFPSPFTEVSESEADTKAVNAKPADTPSKPVIAKAQPAAAKSAQAEENPFTGLTLDEPKTSTAKPAANQAPALPAAKVTAPEPGKIKDPAGGAQIKPISPDRLPPAKIVENDKNLPAAKPKAHADKIKRITARSGMKGLKGFCPVALRDERDLLDTKPDFQSTYGLKTYQFSSAAAKARFDRSPKKYAPAAEGFDVVKLAEATQDVEGVLDHAVWYKDRLYLFATKANMQKFVVSPVDYSIED